MEEKIKKNPMSKIKSLKLDKKGARQALTVEELERLRDACKTYREKALVEFLGFDRLPSERSRAAACGRSQSRRPVGAGHRQG